MQKVYIRNKHIHFAVERKIIIGLRLVWGDRICTLFRTILPDADLRLTPLDLICPSNSPPPLSGGELGASERGRIRRL
jgi:hypothetical protein